MVGIGVYLTSKYLPYDQLLAFKSTLFLNHKGNPLDLYLIYKGQYWKMIEHKTVFDIFIKDFLDLVVSPRVESEGWRKSVKLYD